jgi:hypothetical protein
MYEVICEGFGGIGMKRKENEKLLGISQQGLRLIWILAGILLLSCTPQLQDIIMPLGDVKPPSLLGARQESSQRFEIIFDEDVLPVEKSFACSPSSIKPIPEAAGPCLGVKFSPSVRSGVECSLAGEAKDYTGNTTRFLFTFIGYNDNPAILRLSEVQTGKNSSASNLHRDYFEFYVEKGGDLGAVHIFWASTVKEMEYSFPPCDVKTGDYIVLHCNPENIVEEKDEIGPSTGESQGVDANEAGRDFWTKAGGIPDESGVVIVRVREEAKPHDGFFYVSSDKSGDIDSSKLVKALESLAQAGIIGISSPPRWEDGYQWKPSTSRPLLKTLQEGNETGAWETGDSGSQSPGRKNTYRAPASKKVQEKSLKK